MNDLEMIRALSSKRCVCGKNKGKGMSHCRTCYHSLPPEQKRALYNRVGQGYEEAYEKSIETLGISPKDLEAYASTFRGNAATMQETHNAAGTALEQPSGPETQNQQLAVLPADMTPEVFKARLDHEKKMRAILKEYVQGEMKEGHHYASKLGSLELPKKMLLKEGVQNLCSIFKLFFGPPIIVEERLEGDHYRVRTHIALFNAHGNQIATGDALCSTHETKYAYRTAQRLCPDCEQPTVRKDNKKGGWYCWKKDGVSNGCGSNFVADDPRIIDQQLGRIENPDKADVENTVLKISIKRAKSSAVCDVAMVSEIFAPEGDDKDDDKGSPPPAKAKGTNKGEHVPEQTTSPAPPNGNTETSVEKAVRISKKLLEHKCEMEDLVVQFLPEGVAKFEDLTEGQADEAVPSMIELLNGKIRKSD